MASPADNSPLVALVGATGSGKSALSLELAQSFDGEVIAADSRTVYKAVDISTAKPTKAEQLAIRHHLIDVVSPEQIFTAANFKLLAQKAIDDITARGKIPFLVGGTGLYVDALLYDFTLRPTVIDQSLMAKLSKQSVAELQEYILRKGLELPRDSHNPRRLLRTIQANGVLPTKNELRLDTLVVGLYVEREELRKRITSRVDVMVEAGLVDELKTLIGKYGWEAPALQTPASKAFHGFFDGGSTLEEAKAVFIQNDMNLAKRQLTWFKRNKDVHWVYSKEECVDLVTTFLNKY
jgi:tRNA dimethylallyltransferase